MASIKARRDEREWTPKLKGRKGKSSTTASETSQLANKTMASIKDVSRRRARGEDVDDAFLAKVLRDVDPTAAEKQRAAQLAAAGMKSGTNTWIRPAGLVAVIAGVLLAVSFARSSGGNHSVAGTFVFERREFDGAELVFHPDNPDAKEFRVVTASGGWFHIKNVPTGTYKVTATITEDAKGVLPAIYAKPESTPIKLNLRGDLLDIRLYATQAKRSVSEPSPKFVNSD